MLTLDDLPSGFEAVSPDEYGFTKEAKSEDDFTAESSFAFSEAEHFEYILGYTVLLLTRSDQMLFDKVLPLSDYMKESLLEGVGATNILEQKELPDLDDIGDVSAGLTAVVDVEGILMRLDMVMFRRDIVVVSVSTLYIDGDNPIVTVDDLAGKLDERIIGALQPSD